EYEAAAKDAALLQRKLDQAQADLRRLRGGQPVAEAHDDAELQTLRARIADLESQLAAAARSAVSAATPSGDEARLRRQVEQLQAARGHLRALGKLLGVS